MTAGEKQGGDSDGGQRYAMDWNDFH
jgi:hypothetical protein